MLKFKEVIQQHRAEELATAEAKRLEDLMTQEAQRKFTRAFSEVVIPIARPIFQEFVAELREEGLQATLDELADDKGNAAITVRFTCNPAGEEDCMFGLAADPAISVVQRRTFIGRDDQGSGASHTLQSITNPLIN
jgi:hypothetical protein